jgi:carbamoyltransferase
LIILGLNTYEANASASLLIDGKLVFAVQEDRFRRIKHYTGLPIKAMKYCLNEAGLSLNDIDHLVLSSDPNAKFKERMTFLVKSPSRLLKKQFFENFINPKHLIPIDKVLMSHFNCPKPKFKIHNIEHHRCHLASAFYPSPFNEASLLSLDWSGDFSTAMSGIGRRNNIEILNSVNFPNSIGVFYSALTQFLGFMHYGDEYKVMGLAPYGKPIYKDILAKVIYPTNDGWFKLDTHYLRSPYEGYVTYSEIFQPVIPILYNKNLVDLLGANRYPLQEIKQYHKDIAASVQAVTEEIIFHIVTHLYNKTKIDVLCLSGCVAQNSVLNGKIITNTPIKHLYFPSAVNNSGISVGAAYYVNHQVLTGERQPPIFSAYTGPCFTNDAVRATLENNGLKYKLLSDEDIFEIVCNKLIQGGVVGWFSGRAEFGPHALGARSILMDPRRTDSNEIFNKKIKIHESFVPFSSSILSEYVSEYFEINDDVPFMEKTVLITKEKQSVIPAVTHVDGTGRLQTVDKISSPRFYNLINIFREKTGVPILLNTSFSENGIMVNTPQEAVDFYKHTSMDILVIENCLIQRT